VCENRALRRILGPEKEEVTQGWNHHHMKVLGPSDQEDEGYSWTMNFISRHTDSSPCSWSIISVVKSI
jgi:hypothetical protein